MIALYVIATAVAYLAVGALVARVCVRPRATDDTWRRAQTDREATLTLSLWPVLLICGALSWIPRGLLWLARLAIGRTGGLP